MRFTDRTIAALPNPTNGQHIYADDSLAGFGLRVGATAKAFVLTVGEERRRITLGRYPIVSLAGEIKDWPAERLEGRRVPLYRERALDDDELKRILATARSWRERVHPHDAYGYIIELLVLTGQRRGQIGGLSHSHINFEAGAVSWWPHEMKSKRRHVMPLGQMARELLLRRGRTGLYFSNKHGQVFTYATNLDRQFHKDCRVNGWCLHDIRRTFATQMQRLGVYQSKSPSACSTITD